MQPDPSLRSAADAAALPWLLTGLAGTLDGACAGGIGGTHVAFVSGDTVEAGSALASGHVWAGMTFLAVVAAFVLGAAAGAVLTTRSLRWGVPLALWTIGAASLAAAVGSTLSLSTWAVLPIAAGLGAADAMQKHAGGGVGLSFVSGALLELGARLAQPSRWTLREDGVRLGLWLAFLASSVAGVAAATALGLTTVLAGIAALSLALAGGLHLAHHLHASTSRSEGFPR